MRQSGREAETERKETEIEGNNASKRLASKYGMRRETSYARGREMCIHVQLQIFAT